MNDPVVLEDGYTYEREAIQQWLNSGHDISPMTNARLSHLQLTPNLTLRTAAKEWQVAHTKLRVCCAEQSTTESECSSGSSGSA